MSYCDLTATEAVALMETGEISAEDLARAYLDRIEERDPLIRGWAALDPALAIAKARELDKARLYGAIPSGGLHGLPFGIKDIIDTADLPTRNNAPAYDGYQPAMDANCVRVIRAAGGYVMGKTETVEFAAKGGRRTPARNPHNPEHTPGGSSSGSGALVADRQVPLALGTQTGGSLIRPAAFNGIFALKPTWGTVSWSGSRQNAQELDTIGWYARSAADLLLVARAFRLWQAEAASTPPLEGLRIGLCRGPHWEYASPMMQQALERAGAEMAKAGAIVSDCVLPEPFERLDSMQETIMDSQGVVNFLPEYLEYYHGTGHPFSTLVETRAGYTPEQLVQAQNEAAACRAAFAAQFGADGFDALLTPAALGEAPKGLESTGDARMNSMWTLLHAPCLAIPGIRGEGGLPLGLQLVGPRYSDVRLIGVAEVVAPVLADIGQL